MLTVKVIAQETEKVLKGLEKKHFKNAQETINKVLELDKARRAAQQELDNVLAQNKQLAAKIGQLMKAGQAAEAETVKSDVATLKARAAELQENMDAAAAELQQVLYTIPNIPYDEVPEGVAAEDNVVEKTGGMETELPANALPHWELAKKYDLIDFDLGVKITGAGFPVYKGKGAQLQRALINFFLDEARAAGYVEIMPPTVVNAASGYGTGQLPDKEGQMYHCGLDDLYLIPTAEVPGPNSFPSRTVLIPSASAAKPVHTARTCAALTACTNSQRLRLYALTLPNTARSHTKRCSSMLKAFSRSLNSLTAFSVSAVAT